MLRRLLIVLSCLFVTTTARAAEYVPYFLSFSGDATGFATSNGTALFGGNGTIKGPATLTFSTVEGVSSGPIIGTFMSLRSVTFENVMVALTYAGKTFTLPPVASSNGQGSGFGGAGLAFPPFGLFGVLGGSYFADDATLGNAEIVGSALVFPFFGVVDSDVEGTVFGGSNNTALSFVFGPVTESDNFSQLLGVPEPQAWAMMVLGFGLVGAALRRRGVAIRFGAIA